MPPLDGVGQLLDSIRDDNIVREMIDICQALVRRGSGETVGRLEAAESEEEEEKQDSQDDRASVAAATTGPKTRQRFSYANKRFKADSSFFLNPTFKSSFLQVYPDGDCQLVGKILRVANKNNDNMFTVHWNTSGTMVSHSWTLSQIEGDGKMKKELQALITDYESKNRTDGDTELRARPNRQIENTQSQNSQSSTRNNSQADSVTPGTDIGLEALRARAYSALKTSISARSTRNSGSNGGRSTSSGSDVTTRNVNRRATRASDDTYESESDDDNQELDEFDSAFYYVPPECTAEVEEDSDDEYEEQATDGVPISSQRSYANLVSDLLWQFDPVTSGDKPFDDAKPFLDKPTTLRAGVAEWFTDPFEAFQVLGCDRDFVALLSQHSNDYAKRFILPNHPNKKPHGLKWKDITTVEMYRFLGIMLKISLMPIDGGGYPAYFREGDVEVKYSNSHKARLIQDTKGFAYKYMSIRRFRQIRMAFHPEDKDLAGTGGDKCYQLRRAINSLNQSAKSVFDAGCYFCFDEGGCGCRSRFCPVRQYNKDKPKKFRVDFFILACSATYAIFHIDVYQGRNATNVGVDERLHDLPTTQKATMNAVLSAFGVEERGARHLALDNRYQCPELAALLITKCNVYSTGTCRRNRKGWNRDLFNLTKNQNRGSYKMAADKLNRVICMQWVDSKVVNLVTSLSDTSVEEVKRQVGTINRNIPCPTAYVRYNKTMYGVDKGDQMRVHGGGFSNKAHFQKWYKKQFLAVLDCMLQNALIAWNLSAKQRRTQQRVTLTRHEFLMYVADSMCEYSEAKMASMDGLVSRNLLPPGHVPRQYTGKYAVRCMVCRLESRRGFNPDIGQAGIKSGVCKCDECFVVAHHCIPSVEGRFIHTLPCFDGKTCFEILHTKEGLEIWPPRDNPQQHPNGPRRFAKNHPLVQQLRMFHGRNKVIKPKRKRCTILETDDMSSDDDNNNCI